MQPRFTPEYLLHELARLLNPVLTGWQVEAEILSYSAAQLHLSNGSKTLTVADRTSYILIRGEPGGLSVFVPAEAGIAKLVERIAQAAQELDPNGADSARLEAALDLFRETPNVVVADDGRFWTNDTQTLVSGVVTSPDTVRLSITASAEKIARIVAAI
jgi:hypothetical protein